MNNGNSSIDSQAYDLMKKALDASSTRSRVISNNVANINTANYKRHYVTFEDTLKEASDDLKLKSTNERHITEESKYGDIEVKQDKSSSMRQDGNNVDIDLEKTNQAANTLMYNALITEVNNSLSSKRYVINGR
ncbi:Flagellar basal body rod protein FlgB [Clostridium liquoris]|jgi:flagellar basal-body rod protein FlgB|uniref:Flagellar basal body rod protein FlgB n=1 Tax=Clostridium liquoris TaxID=1289519 RepID=A0A2T0B6B8_9CLOT|nr:flagellar basal body rod protein FlgB [Clostridium liquoris]PRR79426.1 Flagellar basal body rod protein FlgB [Clostridium liquoris]